MEIGEHRVVRTACNLCQNMCGALVHVEAGRIVRVEGDPENPHSLGHLCARGLASYMAVYSPQRIVRPRVRTNPAKGLGVDPRWKTVSWEEAISLVGDRLREVLEKVPLESNPNRIIFLTFDHWSRNHMVATCWCEAIKASMQTAAASAYCGNAIHHPSILNSGYWVLNPDPDLSKYILVIGSQAGGMVQYDTMALARGIAEKRPGNVKVVAVDPMCSGAASKAEEWIPIRPGTDSTFLLGIVNLLLNEYGIYDAKFLREKTNAPYLVGTDGRYVRDPASKKPLVWDLTENASKPFDAKVGEYSLVGSFDVAGVRCKPAFQALKEHVLPYTPRRVSEVTSIPEETICRIAKELGEAASIGSTIKIDGKEFPYRPIALAWYRGLGAHRHAFHTGLAAVLIPTILGAIQTPGGMVGQLVGHAAPDEYVDSDGLMAVNTRHGAPYPPRPVVRPRRLDLFELFPVAPYSNHLIIPVLLRPESFGLGKEEIGLPQMVFTHHDNAVKNTYTPELVVEAFKKIPFIVSFAVEPDETSALADVVFPDLHQFERLAEAIIIRPADLGYWYCAKPAVKPPFEPPYDNLVSNAQILLEIAKRAGFLREVYQVINRLWGLKATPFVLDPGREYSYAELIDRRLQAWLGPDHDLKWLLSDKGGLLKPGLDPEVKYKGHLRKGRIHAYFEFLIQAGEAVRDVTQQMGADWDISDYVPLPSWNPCYSYEKRTGEFDLFAINYKVPMQSHGVLRSNPMLNQLVKSHGFDATLIHPETAKRKGISDGDEVWIETAKGRKVKSAARLSERVHPEVVATMQHRLAKGADFNSLITLDKDTLDFVSCAVDSCLLVKAYRA